MATHTSSQTSPSPKPAAFTVDKDWRIISFPMEAERISGLNAKDILGLHCREAFKDSPALAALHERLAPIASGHEILAFQPETTGNPVDILLSATPVLDPNGNFNGATITLKEQHAPPLTDLILESIADGLFTVDRNWKITSFNHAAEQITGWSRDQVMGRSCSEIFHASICGNTCAIAQSLYSGLPVANHSITIDNIDGLKIPISISAAPLHDQDGNIIGGVESFRDLRERISQRRQSGRRSTFGEIISKSSTIRRIFDILPEISTSESNVLVLGESGTGKELIASAVHNASTRKKGPFITVNCGALPETLLESELFGYKAGAFTDAKHDRLGRFAAAEKGTLFLDEIGDIPAALQVKLLRVLQNKVYEPLGSNQPVTADVRIIAATNRNLQELVEEGSFREDLYYRLNVVKISLPPLRDRMEDIPLLCEHFIKKFCAQQGKDIVGLSDAALNILTGHHFPGNIRELENIIEYAFILCHGGFIQPEHLPEPFAPRTQGKHTSIQEAENKPLTLEEIEKEAIFRTLERNNWRKLATCRELGISKDTLRRKISRYELESYLQDDDD